MKVNHSKQEQQEDGEQDNQWRQDTRPYIHFFFSPL
jgi:hypothetical protein